MSTNPTDTALSVFLEQGRELVRTLGVGELILKARALKIADDESFSSAGQIRSALKAAEKGALERFGKLRNPLNELRSNILALEDEVVSPIKRAVSDLDLATTTYRNEQQRLADEKRRADEAAARKIEEDRRLQEAAAAVANGVPEAEALAVMDEPLMPVLAPVAPVVPKIPGQAYVTLWSAEVVDHKRFVAYIGTHPELGHLVLPNMVALNQLAKASQAALSIPGVRPVAKQTVRGRSA